MADIIELTLEESKNEELNIENIWRILREKIMDVGYLQKDECPVAYITNQSYFDIYNVFIQQKEPQPKKSKYLYLCKLKSIIQFPENSLDDVKYFTKIVERRTLERDQKLKLKLKSKRPTIITQYFVDKAIVVQITGLRKYSVIPNWTKKTFPTISRQYPGLSNASQITIISEVLVADAIEIVAHFTYPDFTTQMKNWSHPGPVIIAFGATDLQLKGKEGQVVNEIPVPRQRLLSHEDWVYLQPSAPLQRKSLIIWKLRKGGHYDLSRPLPARRDLVPILTEDIRDKIDKITANENTEQQQEQKQIDE